MKPTCVQIHSERVPVTISYFAQLSFLSSNSGALWSHERSPLPVTVDRVTVTAKDCVHEKNQLLLKLEEWIATGLEKSLSGVW